MLVGVDPRRDVGYGVVLQHEEDAFALFDTIPGGTLSRPPVLSYYDTPLHINHLAGCSFNHPFDLVGPVASTPSMIPGGCTCLCVHGDFCLESRRDQRVNCPAD